MVLRTLAATFFLVSCALAQTSSQSTQPPATSTPAPKVPVVKQSIEVTATRQPEDPESVPTAIEVFSGEELQNRGARDLRSALAFATGVEIAPGGDSGPASSVPGFWGLKEFDAFLLVVDGVPWGGAFNPALTSLNLSDVERVEVMRGPAAVTYGATSFVGVIHVVHKDTESKDRTLEFHGGSFNSGGISFSTPIPVWSDWSSRLTLEAAREGQNDERTAYRRGHGLWRFSHKPSASTRTWVNADVNWLDQDPASPRARDGATLSPLNPVDANYNPAGAALNDHRATITAGFDRPLGNAQWFLTGSVSRSSQNSFRGFLQDLSNNPDNARGLRENIRLTDIYFDTHFVWKLPRSVTFLTGVDFIHGTGNAEGVDFDYTVPLSGIPAVAAPAPGPLDVQIRDRRNFFGPYASMEWRPWERFRIDAGLRLNVANERQRYSDPGAGRDLRDQRTDVRAGANIGAMFTAWGRGQDSIGLFANYRNTFKPAAIDFGIEAFGGSLILKPETSQSVEGGLKGRFFGRRMSVEASGFWMDFANLVTSIDVGGVPTLINAGTQEFKGFESEMSLLLTGAWVARATYSYHDARFTDFVQDFGGVPVQLAGKRLEMSANNLAAFGIHYSPARGFLGGVEMNYTGGRFLNKRNTAAADGFASVGISAGYRMPRWEVRVDARNLSDQRDPVAESELGDAQYYLLPSRRVDVSFRIHF